MANCSACGQPAASGAKFCTACGKPIASEPAAPSAPARGNAITWPFQQKNWLGSLWILLVGWFPLPLPLTLSFGWLLDAAGRRSRHDAELLPKARSILSMYRDGIIFWLALIIYFLIPLLIFDAIFAQETGGIAQDTQEWLAGWLSNIAIPVANSVIVPLTGEHIDLVAQETFPDFLTREMTRYFTVVLELVVYLLIATSLFLAGTMRFITTRRIGSYLNPFGSLSLTLAHLPRLLLLAMLLTVLNVILLSIPAVGGILWLTAGVWIAAALIGNLALKLRDRHAVG